MPYNNRSLEFDGWKLAGSIFPEFLQDFVKKCNQRLVLRILCNVSINKMNTGLKLEETEG